MLRRIRLRETERLETSSEPDFTYSSLSIFPKLTSEAIRDILRTGKITSKPRSASMSKMTSRNTPASAPAISQRSCCALANGTESGTVTIWAPMISLSFQPKPFCRPYARVVAAKAILVDDERMGQVQDAAAMGVALGYQLRLAGIVAEIVDNVGFPVGSTMRGIGRVESRFPIGEFRMLLVKRFEIMNGGIGRDRLRIELFVLKPVKDWSNLLRGIVTNGLRALHEQARLCQNLLFLFGLKDRCSYKSKKDKSQSSDSQKHKIELSSDTHPSEIHDARLSSDPSSTSSEPGTEATIGNIIHIHDEKPGQVRPSRHVLRPPAPRIRGTLNGRVRLT
jgi:hypothetical protein